MLVSMLSLAVQLNTMVSEPTVLLAGALKLTFGGVTSILTVKLLVLKAEFSAKSKQRTSQTKVLSVTVVALKTLCWPDTASIVWFEAQVPVKLWYNVQFFRFTSIG